MPPLSAEDPVSVVFFAESGGISKSSDGIAAAVGGSIETAISSFDCASYSEP